MCRFIAVISKEDFDPTPYIEELVRMAKEGKNNPHKDGWGVWIKGSEGECLHKETVPIWKSNVGRLPKARILMAHARKRGDGAKISLENTHPFLAKGAVFMHNGLINIEHPEAVGETDSEKLFMHIVHRGLWNFLCEIEKYEFSSINSVLYEEGNLFAIRYAREKEDYYTLFLRRVEGKVIISTEGPGEEIPNRSVVRIDENLKVEVLPLCPGMFR